MKKLNLLKTAAALLASAVLLSSCKSSPDLAPVEPLELLDGDSALYLSIPVQANSDFISSAISKIAGLTEGDSQKIAERLDMAFLSIKNNGSFQFSASGNLPVKYAAMALNDKNGWQGGLKGGQVCYTHRQTSYQLCLPSSSNAFLSSDIAPMVDRFNRLAYAAFTEEDLSPEQKSSLAASAKVFSQTMDSRIYSYLHDNNSPDILMYAPDPSAFVKSFIGREINTNVDSLFAVLSQYRGVKEQFNVKLTVNLQDPRTVKATTALLKTLLFGVPAKVVQTGQKQITITDLPVTKKRIISLFN
ncbi:MAG: hypothetical protein K5873_10015 [Treponema sp.]|nr:hypothetical protein [Treponema sp.]